jgi:FixJ family two-component response regulator
MTTTTPAADPDLLVDEVAVQRAATGHRCRLTPAERREVIRQVAEGLADRRLAADGLGVTLGAITRAVDRHRRRAHPD